MGPTSDNTDDQSSFNPQAGLADQSKLKAVAELVYKKNLELVRLDKMKDEFVAIVSHELRTPLTIIKNYLWLVVNRDKDQVGQEPMKKVNIAIQSVDRLMALVEDTLTVSRIENDKITLRKEQFDIIQRLKYILEIYSVHAQDKKVKLITSIGVDSIMITGDINRIHEVIVNILGNGLKFTPEGGSITISCRKSSDEKSVVIRMTDTGPGIPKDKQDILFSKFGKIDESYANLPNVNGTGLGLYISQQIMKLHEGSLGVESEYGHGATFIMSIPIGPTQPSSLS